MSTDLPRPEETDEFEIRDDAIIGKAFMWSLLVFGCLAVLGLAVWGVVALQGEPDEIVIEKDIVAPAPLVADVALLPAVQFSDVSKASGLVVPHVSGATGEKLLPETMGSGAAFVDLDGDGDQDLLLGSGAWWPGDSADHGETATRGYLNDGSGRFDADGGRWDIGHGVYATGLAVGDWDADGHIDVFLAALGGDRLYRNTGSGFEDVTERAGVAGDGDAWSTSPAFVDVDGDGDLDLFVPHYVKWSRQKDLSLGFTINGTDRAYGPPKQYEGTHATLWLNRGDGTFEDVSAASGMVVQNDATGAAVGKSLAVAPADLDADGDMDLIVANDTTRNFYFRNRGDGTFEEIAIRAGLAIENITSAIFADFDNDGDKDAFLGRYLRRSLYLINEEGHFVDKSADLVATPLPYLVSSISAADYNKDGLMDVYLSTYGFPGGTPLAKVWAPKFLEPRDAEEVTRRMYGPERKKYYHRYLSAVGPPNLLLVNQGDGKFAVAPENSRLAVWLHSFQSAWSDFDRDGAPDVYVSSDFGPDSLFRNDLDGGFVDVTREQGGEAMMGFGMGAS